MKRKKRGKTLWITAGALLFVMVFLPYCLPLSQPVAQGAAPFDNSAFYAQEGIFLHYRTFVPEKADFFGKLLLVHGFAGSTFSFEALAPLLAKEGYLVVAVDLPGFGYSDRNLSFDHSQANRAQLAWGLLAHIDQGLPPGFAAMPWHLLGHSMGGSTVVSMALDSKARVASLILLNAALFEQGAGAALWRIPPLSRWLPVALERVLINEGTIRSLLASAYGSQPEAWQVAGYLAPLQLPGTASSFVNMLKTTKNEDVSQLSGLKLPLLSIRGQEDTWVSKGQQDRLLALLPDTTSRVIPQAHHCPMETHPSQVMDILLPWLAQAANTK